MFDVIDVTLSELCASSNPFDEDNDNTFTIEDEDGDTLFEARFYFEHE